MYEVPAGEENFEMNSSSKIILEVPFTAQISFKSKGVDSPLAITNSIEMVTPRTELPILGDPKHSYEELKSVFILATTTGEDDIEITPFEGAKRIIHMTITPSGYFQAPQLPPPTKITFSAAQTTQQVDVNGYDDIEAIIPGNVSDGWEVSPVAETGFELTRIEPIDIGNKQPHVKLFLANHRNPNTSTMILRQGHGFFTKKWKIKIRAYPTPQC